MKRTIVILGLTSAVALGALTALPAVAAEEMIYGRELMSEQERSEHREHMRNLKTEAEREAYRQEHHERMRERARLQGKTLPEAPQPHGKGMGYGPRDGSGAGPGQGGMGRR